MRKSGELTLSAKSGLRLFSLIPVIQSARSPQAVLNQGHKFRLSDWQPRGGSVHRARPVDEQTGQNLAVTTFSQSRPSHQFNGIESAVCSDDFLHPYPSSYKNLAAACPCELNAVLWILQTMKVGACEACLTDRKSVRASLRFTDAGFSPMILRKNDWNADGIHFQ